MADFGASFPPPATSVIPGDFTVANMPDPTENARKYAWVTDLHDGNPDYCISAGGFWKPVRPLVVNNVANANTNMTFQPLKNAPTQILKGTLTAIRTMTISPTMAYPGARFRIKREAGGLFNVLIGGLGLSLNSWADWEYDGTQWVQTASGGLL